MLRKDYIYSFSQGIYPTRHDLQMKHLLGNCLEKETRTNDYDVAHNGMKPIETYQQKSPKNNIMKNIKYLKN